jgi:large conductance mechanosensitive channel
VAKTEKERQEELKAVKKELAAERQARRDLTAELAGAPSKQLHGFIDFIREKGVVGLAIGLAIGTAATGLVNQIVNAVITPTVNLVIGENGLKGWNVIVHLGTHHALYKFGDLMDALIKFIAIAGVIYFVVMGLKLDRLDKKKEG